MINKYSPTFLKALDKTKVRTQYARITVLNFDEKPIREIQGVINSGTVTVNGSAAIRRTLSLGMVGNTQISDVENLENIISLNKKIEVYIGYDNYLIDYQEEYGEIIWFPLGIFVVSSASISSAATSFTLNIQGKDKMCLLDGSVGGTISSPAVFHEIQVVDEDGNITYEYPTIFQIIQELVHHIGGEPLYKIIIEDLDEQSKLLLKYNGDDPIRFTEDYTSFIISKRDNVNYPKVYYKNDDIGYELTDTTFPGELNSNAGETIVSVLDKIAKAFGNFEFFYDLQGNFHFREKRNYLNNSYTPLTEIDGSHYIRNFNESQYSFVFDNEEGTISINSNPKYENIKNDFVVWGQQEFASGAKRDFMYHLAIDEKPQIDWANQYIYESLRYNFMTNCTLKNKKMYNANGYEILHQKDEEQIYYITKDNVAYLYSFSEESYFVVENFTTQDTIIINSDKILHPQGEVFFHIDDEPYRLISQPVASPDWREEMYLQAYQRQILGTSEWGYDQELLANWRKIYDPTKWENGFSPEVYTNPQNLPYWLDFIDTGSAMGAYSVKAIGRRNKTVNDTKIKLMYAPPIPDIIFLKNENDITETIVDLTQKGQNYCLYQPSQEDLFIASGTGASAFDKIRELMYQHLIYNTQLTISCQPKYYLEPNTLIYIKDKSTNINGAFIITQFTLPLTYNGNMSITCAQAQQRI